MKNKNVVIAFGKGVRKEYHYDIIEKWTKIKINNEFKGYWVSNLGRVKSPNGILANTISGSGYVTIKMQKKTYAVHILVAKAFIANPNNYPEVNHIDGDKSNNCIENLEWTDHSGNIQHALKTGLMVSKPEFDARHNIYTKDQVTRVFCLLKEGIPIKTISQITNVGIDTIRLIKSGKRYGKLAKEFNYIPQEPHHQIDISPYENDIRALIKLKKSNKEIRRLIPILNLSEAQYNYHIRRIKKSTKFND